MKKFTSSGIEYHIQEFLGEGGCSEVYRVKRRLNDLEVDQELALKILKSKTPVDILRNEFQEFHSLQSSHLIRILGFDRVDGRPALLLEYIRGFSLSELKKYQNLPLSLKLEILWQIQQGLKDLHQLGKCHGDLSPNNILIENTGRVVLTDFLGQQSGFGNLEFSAPEVLKGGPPTAESDQYSFEKITLWLSVKDWMAHSYINSKQELASIVEEQLKAKHGRNGLTQPLPQEKYNKLQLRLGVVMYFIALLFLPLMAGSTASSFHRTDYTVEIITENWAEIVINDQSLGYPPILYISQSPNIKIKWKNQNANGQKHLVLRPGEHRRIHDEELFNLPEE